MANLIVYKKSNSNQNQKKLFYFKAIVNYKLNIIIIFVVFIRARKALGNLVSNVKFCCFQIDFFKDRIKVGVSCMNKQDNSRIQKKNNSCIIY